MPEEKQTLEQAVDAAIADATPEPRAETPPNDEQGAAPDGSSQDTDTPAGDGAGEGDEDRGAGGDEEAGAGGDDPDQSGDGSGDAGDAEPGGEGAEGAADGKREDGAPAAAAKTNGKDVDPGAGKKKPDPKQPDHVNDPIPKELNERTRERMTSLVDTVKTVTRERDEVRDQNQTFLKAIAETGADPETFARHVEVLRLINSEDPGEQRKASKMLRTVADRIDKDLGDAQPGKELEGHADLEQEVEDGDLTRERAIEIANARNRAAADTARSERARTVNDAKTAGEQAVAAGRDAMNELEQELIEKDKPELYYAKRAMIEKSIKALLPDIPPAKWAATYRRMYNSIDVKDIRAPAPRVGDGGRRRAPAGTGDRQPIRPRQGAGGGGVKEPTSLAEAIDFGIEQARR